jgi:hypothetical protein
VSPATFESRYQVNAIGGAMSLALRQRKVSLGLRYFQEFWNRSTYEGYSLQIAGSIAF